MGVRLRPYAPDDRDAVCELHRKHGEELFFAHPDDPVNVITHVAEDDTSGEIVGCVTARATVEGFLMLDPKWGTPAERWEMSKGLIDSVARACHEGGLSEAHLGVRLDRFPGFARRLAREPNFYLDDKRAWLVMALWERYGAKEEKSA